MMIKLSAEVQSIMIPIITLIIRLVKVKSLKGIKQTSFNLEIEKYI
jgi:hypothetical protein